jgi:hypothetical protein
MNSKFEMLTYSYVLAKQKLSWLWMSNIVVTYEIRVFFEGAQKKVFSTMMSNKSIILKDAKKFPKFVSWIPIW